MAHTLARTRPFALRGSAGSPGGVFTSAGFILAAAGAASRTSVAVNGRRRPSEADLKVLGIEDTPAYRAVVRH